MSERDRTVSRDVAASSFSVTPPGRVALGDVSQIEPVHTPCAPSASAAAICRPDPMPPAASTGSRRDRVDDLGDEHHRRDLAGVAAGLGALGDDDVDALLDLLARLLGAADERGDLHAVLVRVRR